MLTGLTAALLKESRGALKCLEEAVPGACPAHKDLELKVGGEEPG